MFSTLPVFLMATLEGPVKALSTLLPNLPPHTESINEYGDAAQCALRVTMLKLHHIQKLLHEFSLGL